ncbi:sugar transferase [Sphingomonas bacterium]|uniref:sugar transferase n=1 Tax=Sphingomonas bacterium TaxID=1895847 RepID=UPI0020C620FD|nr:sugar transferase [Sphingomonas bacterium]
MSKTLDLMTLERLFDPSKNVSVRVSWTRSGGNAPTMGPGRTDTDWASRALDIAIALVALVFLSPFLFLIALLVWQSGGPALFGHRRIGMGGKAFTCWKFRTMHVDSDHLLHEVLATCAIARREWECDHKLRSDPRISRIGMFLRKSSLDELPQLLNVLNGTMSIVGPRPIVQAEAFRYGRYFTFYCEVRPGITGLWQVNGRNSTTYRRRVACDVMYVRSKAPINDIRIMLKTIPAVCFARGAY